MTPAIDLALAARLIGSQFPQWAGLPLSPIPAGGWDNRTFRLGDSMLVRLPSAREYAGQVEKEHRWLPRLAPHLPFAIPEPLALGEPGFGYPFNWSVYRWIEGESAASADIADSEGFASDVARFLSALQAIDAEQGPRPGAHNFFRGGDLASYDGEARAALARLSASIDVRVATRIWDGALASRWPCDPVWVHGDMSAGNLLVRDGQLAAVIDFGQLAVGDPACDLAMAWTFFGAAGRKTFRERLPLDEDTWRRGRGWALWKAAIVAAGMTDTNAVEKAQSGRTLRELLNPADRPAA